MVNWLTRGNRCSLRSLRTQKLSTIWELCNRWMEFQSARRNFSCRGGKRFALVHWRVSRRDNIWINIRAISGFTEPVVLGKCSVLVSAEISHGFTQSLQVGSGITPRLGYDYFLSDPLLFIIRVFYTPTECSLATDRAVSIARLATRWMAEGLVFESR